MSDLLDPTYPLFDQGYGNNNPSSLDPFSAPVGISNTPDNPVSLTTGLQGVSPLGSQSDNNLSTNPVGAKRTPADNTVLGIAAPISAGLGAGEAAATPTVDSGQATINAVETGLAGAATGASAGAAIGAGGGPVGAAVGGVVGLVAGGVNAYFSVKNARAQKRQEAALIAKAQARQDARDAQARQDAIGQLAYNRRQTALQNLHLAQQNALSNMNDILKNNQDIKDKFIKYGR
jgi:hypothetical protein